MVSRGHKAYCCTDNMHAIEHLMSTTYTTPLEESSSLRKGHAITHKQLSGTILMSTVTVVRDHTDVYHNSLGGGNRDVMRKLEVSPPLR